MTTYTSEELAAGFEFKILRSATNRFKDAAFLRQCLADEARAGWTLVEKFDDGRIRLKRPAAARKDDAGLTGDPYRTWVGMSDGRMALMIVGCVVGALAVIGLIAVLATR